MKKLLTIAALLLPLAAAAQRVDTNATDPDKYVPELGYFQKAHSDASDPRFMMTFGDGKFSLGLGGTVHFNSYLDFQGSIDSYCFSPGAIEIPVDNTNHFGYTVAGTNIYVKARAGAGKNKITAYLSLSGNEDNSGANYIMLGKAYISYNGLTVGKTYSFFMDLEAGPMTVDLQGPNTQISRTHSLIGFTQPLGSHWVVAAALEAPHPLGTAWKSEGIWPDYNKYPDVAAHVKYRGEKGHIQLGMLVRQLSYWVSKTGFEVAADGATKYVWGYGVSLSGNYNPTEKLSFSAQGLYGSGVSYYIQDLAPLGLSLGLEAQPDAEGYPILTPLASYGGYVSASYKWSDKVRTSVVYGLCDLGSRGLYTAKPFKRTDYVAANVFYFFSPYCFLGVEYLFGYKVIQADPGAADSGYANRINACMCYRF